MNYFEQRVSTMASAASGNVFGMLAWIDPAGQWWMAPLGSPAPDMDAPMPAPWIPIKRLERQQADGF
jgi:hypothetical protein